MSVPAANDAARAAYDERTQTGAGAGRGAGAIERFVHVPRERVARVRAGEGQDPNRIDDVPGYVARRHSRSRCDPGDGRALLRDVTVRHGRAGHQSGAARRRFHPRDGRRPRRRQRRVRSGQSWQARDGPRPLAAGGPRCLHPARAIRRHPDRELQARRDGAAGPRLPDARAREPAARSTPRSRGSARPGPKPRRAASISWRRACRASCR